MGQMSKSVDLKVAVATFPFRNKTQKTPVFMYFGLFFNGRPIEETYIIGMLLLYPQN